MIEKFEYYFVEFKSEPSEEAFDECLESAFMALSEKLEALQYDFDNLEEMLRAAVLAQIISDESIWQKMYANGFEVEDLHRYNNYFYLLLNNLKTI